MKPSFGIFRHIERRKSNGIETSRKENSAIVSRTVYDVEVVRFVLFWITIWTHEKNA